MARILIIDDDPGILNVISDILKTNDHEISTAPDGKSGIKELDSDNYDLVITDLMMPGVGGMEVLEHALINSSKTMFIILTGYGTIRGSVEAIKKGAFDYITKPVTASELLVVVEKALKFRSLEEENIRLKKELRRKYRYDNLVGTSDAIKKIYDLIEKVADTDGTILISGPTGTGKELIARAIHYNSSRDDKPLVVINCGAIPEELLESELFGHEKGAFTGAHKTRIGRFEMANGGTIFLDEIGEMSPALQVKLLRILQERKFERVGGTKSIHVDIRIIAATNRNLTAAINNGMIVKVGVDRYVIPTLTIQEFFRPERTEYHTVKGEGEVIMFRDHLVPLIRLNRLFGLNGNSSSNGIDSPAWEKLVVVVENQEKRRCLLVDELIGQEEIVIKSLGEKFKDTKGIAGAAIMGDGTVGLILDISGIFSIFSEGL